jgi:hypothetical protein
MQNEQQRKEAAHESLNKKLEPQVESFQQKMERFSAEIKETGRELTQDEKKAYIEARNWQEASPKERLDLINDLYDQITQTTYDDLSTDDRAFYDRYAEHYPHLKPPEIMSVVRPPSDIDADLYAVRMKLINQAQNEIRAKHGLAPLPDRWLTNSDIEELQAAGAIQDFLNKEEILPSGRTYKPNSILSHRIQQHVALKELKQRRQERQDIQERELKSEYQKCLAIPKQTKIENGRSVISDEFLLWETKTTDLLRRVRKQVSILDSKRKNGLDVADKRHYLYHLEKSLANLLENHQPLQDE